MLSHTPSLIASWQQSVSAQCLMWLAALLACSALAMPAEACRYNVRDVGFVDLGEQPYTLILGYSPDSSGAALDSLHWIATPALGESNVAWKQLSFLEAAERDILSSEDSKGMAGSRLWLLTPSGQVRQLAAYEDGLPAASEIELRIKTLVNSASHEQLLKQTIDCHSVVMVIEGKNADENKRVVADAEEAIRQTFERRGEWDKPIARAPRLMVLSPNDPLLDVCHGVGVKDDFRSCTTRCLLWTGGGIRRCSPR